MATLSSYRPEPAFPKTLFVEQAGFAVLVWAGFTVTMLAITFGVSLFRDIEVSGWQIAGQLARWFGFVIGTYLGWSLFQLHVTHGGTRAGFMRQMAGFVPAYGAVLGALFTLTFLIEAGVYALAGWPQVVNETQLYASPLDVPMVFVQWGLIMTLWTAGGLTIAATWYRNAAFGALAIPIGLLVTAISSIALTGESGGPLVFIHDTLFGGGRPSVPMAIGVHVMLIAAMIGVSWLALRDAPIHTKSE